MRQLSLRFLALAAFAASLLATSASATEVTLLGPVALAREAGRPIFLLRNFPAVAGEGTLVIDVERAKRRGRVQSVWVWLNGRRVLGPRDLRGHGSQFEVPVPLEERNWIFALVLGEPGNRLQLAIAEEIDVELVPGPAGLAREDGSLLVALPIVNQGGEAADEVRVTSASLVPADLLSPMDLPISLGGIEPEKDAVFQAAFSSGDLVGAAHHHLQLAGTFRVGAVVAPFEVATHIRVPEQAPGSAPVLQAFAQPEFVFGAPYPPIPLPAERFDGLNEEAAPPTPIGTLRGDLQPTGLTTQMTLVPPTRDTGAAVLGAAAAPQGVGDPVVFVRSSSYGSVGGTWLDATGASNDPVVMGTFNGPTSVSFDGGVTFPLSLNPASVFPQSDGGFCCDQVMQYIPQIDRFVWLIQYRRAMLRGDVACVSSGEPEGCGPTGPNRYRLAVASTSQLILSNGTSWTYWDLTSALFGAPASWMDFPSLAVGDNFLYLSADMVGSGGGYFVARIPLAQIQAPTTIEIRYTDPSAGFKGAWQSHLAQNVTDTAYWAGHNGTSKLRIFSFPENSTSYFWHDVVIDTWPNEDYSSITPSGFNWQKKNVGDAIIGATRLPRTRFENGQALLVDELWFAWGAGRGGGFAQPHIQVVAIDAFDYTKLGQSQIHNSDFAFGFPALSTNSHGQVGVALGLGGGEAHTNFGVGFMGENLVYIPKVATGSRSRYADYFGLRRHSPNAALFSAFGMYYDLKPGETICEPATNCTTELHYFLFGRESAFDPPPPPPR